ncbi:ABC transporter permease [Streptomyces flavovirens]|uniref:ABC transporter permease n=1 Tax=Streptomyces flavovirens TaxID=52258 RepID=UPI0031EFF9B9
MWRLALRTLKFRRTSFVATFLAMFLGAAIVIGCGGLMETGVRMAADPLRLDGAPVVVTGEQTYDGAALTERHRIDPALVGEVARADGVGEAVGDVSFPATVLKDGKALTGEDASYGHGWASARLAPYTLAAGGSPAAGGEVVLDAGLAERAGVRPGSAVDVVVGGETRRFTVSGVTGPRGGDDADAAVFFSDEQARTLAGGRIDSIGVLPKDGADTAAVADAVRSAVGDRAEVLTGERRGLAELPGTLSSQRTVVILAAIFGSSVVLIVMFGVASTLGLSLQQRTREMALLRAVGSTPRQLRRMILTETAVLSVGSVLLALYPGYLLGKLLFRVLTSSGVVSASIVYHAGWMPMAVGAVVTVLAAAGATRFAGRRAARTEPVAALAESAVGTRWFSVPRLLIALFFLANGIGPRRRHRHGDGGRPHPRQHRRTGLRALLHRPGAARPRYHQGDGRPAAPAGARPSPASPACSPCATPRRPTSVWREPSRPSSCSSASPPAPSTCRPPRTTSPSAPTTATSWPTTSSTPPRRLRPRRRRPGPGDPRRGRRVRVRHQPGIRGRPRRAGRRRIPGRVGGGRAAEPRSAARRRLTGRPARRHRRPLRQEGRGVRRGDRRPAAAAPRRRHRRTPHRRRPLRRQPQAAVRDPARGDPGPAHERRPPAPDPGPLRTGRRARGP